MATTSLTFRRCCVAFLLLATAVASKDATVAATATERQHLSTPPHSGVATRALKNKPAFPLVVVSTLDGLVAGFAPHNGPAPLWVLSPATGVHQHEMSRSVDALQPAVYSHQTPGWPELLPAVDGTVFVIPVEDPAPPASPPRRVEADQLVYSADGKRATLVSKVETRVLFVDPQTGEVLRTQTVGDHHAASSTGDAANILPLNDLPDRARVLILSHTTHSVQARDVASNAVVSNATLAKVSSVLVDSAACIPPSAELLGSASALVGHDDATETASSFTATVSSSRHTLSLHDVATNSKKVWTAHLRSPVVHAEGLAGVSLQLLPDAPQLPAGTRALSAWQPWPPPHTHSSIVEQQPPAARDSSVPELTPPVAQVNVLVALVIGGALCGALLVVAVQRWRRATTSGTSKSARKRNRRKKEKLEQQLAGETPNNTYPDNRDVTDTPANALENAFTKPTPDAIQTMLPRSLPVDPESNQSTESNGGGGGLPAVVPRQAPVRDPETGRLVIGRISITSKVLGYGSHGTLVYEGYMEPEGRRVAVKRLLRQFYDAARKEIRMLIELDEASPWVLRYFAMEEDSEFIYLALELCDASLGDKVAKGQFPALAKVAPGCIPHQGQVAIPMATRTALFEMMSGLADLHENGVVHRDFKPQNILIGYPKNNEDCGRVRIADVGLALKLEGDRSSYTAATGAGAGTVGWRAPEVLAGARQTKSVDIFSAGCILGYVLTGGHHPFGHQAYERDGNIMSGVCDLNELHARGYAEATHLVARMLCREPRLRLTANQVIRHPFFWSDATRLNFLIDVWDRLSETERRHGTDRLDAMPGVARRYGTWPEAIDMEVLKCLYRPYESTVSGLIRCIRNKRSHYAEFPMETRKLVGPLPHDSSQDTGSHNFGRYFFSRFPSLVTDVVSFTSSHSAFTSDPHFERYFDADVSSNADDVSRNTSIRTAIREAGGGEYPTSPGGWRPKLHDGGTSRGDRVSDGVSGLGLSRFASRRAVVEREMFIGAMGAPRTRSFPGEESDFWDVADSCGVLDSTAGFRWRRRLRSISRAGGATGTGRASGPPPGFG